jgi:chlorobactene glucosyltransferase
VVGRFPADPDVELALSVLWLIAVVWLILRAWRQRDALRSLLPVPASGETPSVAVIVPARDEAVNIARCLAGLSAQAGSGLRILVVDDQSTDATAAIAAASAERDPRIRPLRAPSLPPGWIGKCHACWIGARAADSPDWLCFMDADVTAEPVLIASAVRTAETEALDLLSLAPRHELESFAERLILPCGFYLLAFMRDLRGIAAPDRPEAHVTGQFLLIRRAAYEAAGGHRAVRNAICEDTALAGLIKRSGRRIALYGGERLLSTRMYAGWRSLWPGLAKNLVEMLGGTGSTILIALAGLALAWAAVLVPLLDVSACRAGVPRACAALALALPASAAAFGLHLAGTRFFHIPFWYGLVFPLGYTVGALIAIDSVRRRLSGRVSWKGRTYP